MRSTAFRVSVTVPLEEAKKIKYLPIDVRLPWKCSQEGTFGSYEEGCQNLEEDYPQARPYYQDSNGKNTYGALANPSLVDDTYVQNDHLLGQFQTKILISHLITVIGKLFLMMLILILRPSLIMLKFLIRNPILLLNIMLQNLKIWLIRMFLALHYGRRSGGLM